MNPTFQGVVRIITDRGDVEGLADFVYESDGASPRWHGTVSVPVPEFLGAYVSTVPVEIAIGFNRSKATILDSIPGDDQHLLHLAGVGQPPF